MYKKNLLDFIEFRWLCKFFRQTSRVSWLNSAVKKSQCQVNVKGYCPNLTLVLIITCSMEKSVDLISKKEKHVWNQHLSVANSKCLQWTLALVKRFKKTINITFYCPKMHCKPHQRILQKKRMHGMESIWIRFCQTVNVLCQTKSNQRHSIKMVFCGQ